MSHAITCKSLSAAMVRAIQTTESFDTTDEYTIKVSDTSVVWPPAVKRALRLKFLPTFTSNMSWHFTCWYPGEMLSTCFLPFLECWSDSRFASSTILGILIPNLWAPTQYLDMIFAMILFLVFKVCGTHQENAGSSANLDWTAYSDVCMTLFRILQGDPSGDPSFHWTRSFHLIVVPLRLRVRYE